MKKWIPPVIILVITVTCLTTSNTYFNFYQDKSKPVNTNFYMSESISPESSNDYYSLALSYYNNKDYHSAIKHFQNAIELDSNYSYAYYKLAESYAHIDNYDMALKYYNNFKNLNPSDKKIHRTIARLEKKQQKYASLTH